jgi:hypothetical protein
VTGDFPHLPQTVKPSFDMGIETIMSWLKPFGRCEVVVMRDLTPSYVPETGEVILDGPPAGPAGEAGLVPVAGMELAFDRADGHLVRAIVDASTAPAMELVAKLFGRHAAGTLRDLAGRGDSARPQAISPAAGLSAALSSLARLDAARATSPVPASSPWWAAEAAVLAEQAGLRSRTLAEAGRASYTQRGGRSNKFRQSGMDVAAEVANLQKNCLPGLYWVLDPGLTPPEVFRPGLTPYSDLRVRHDVGSGCVIVQATLAPGADHEAAGRWHVRLVDPSRPAQWRVLAESEFKVVGSRLLAELLPPDGSGETWIEVVDDPERPVRSSKAHRIQRALRWADAALRAERAPEGIAPKSTSADWAALSRIAWERCRLDWEAAGDYGRAAAVLVSRMPVPGPVYLAEILGE